MRGGGTRAELARKTASSRRRRERYTRDQSRDLWGIKRSLAPDDDGGQDDETDTPR